MRKSVAIFSILFIASFLAGCASTSFTAKDTVPEYSVIKMSENYEYISAEFNYPQFKDKKFNQLNKDIKAFVERNYNFFKKDAKEIFYSFEKATGQKPAKNFFSLSTDNISQGKNITSVLFVNSYYESGAAHGNTLLKSFNFDSEKQKYVKLTEVVNKSIKEVSDESRKQLLSKKLPKDMVYDGTTPASDNFSTFTVNGNSTTIWFEPYAVAPYAAGIQSVTLH